MKNISEMTIGIASDHAGYTLKQKLRLFLEDAGAKVIDYGCHSAESCDYPDYAHPLGYAMDRGEIDYGVVVCSTGNGIAMTVNKHSSVRAALCWETTLAQLARQHNDANVLAIPANFIPATRAIKIAHVFFTTEFEGGRHARRVSKIALH